MSEEQEAVEEVVTEGQEVETQEQPTGEVETATPAESEGTVETGEVEATPARTVPLEALQDEREKRQRERSRNDELERKLDSLIHQNKPAEVVPDEKRPQIEDYGYDEEKFRQADVNFQVRQTLKVERQNQVKQQQQNQQKEYVRDYQTRVNNTNSMGARNFDDYIEKVTDNPDLKITPLMADVVSASDIGHEIAYHLGNNIEEAEKIAQKPPHLQAAAIGRLEAQLKATPVKKVTSTPAPIKPVGGGGGQANVSDDKLTDAEWEKKYHG